MANQYANLNIDEIKEVVKLKLIIERLRLEDITVEEIDNEMPLFGDGLGLDSVEAFEVMVGMEELFGIEVEGIPIEDLKTHMFSVDTLAAFIKSKAE
jgi:acyl carrier protein